ncbi:MAG: peptide-binding protein [Candidatus Omnitrophota bacterium]|nr:peptide-binding protein [Candidatus Omnitrophota bacterium]
MNRLLPIFDKKMFINSKIPLMILAVFFFFLTISDPGSESFGNDEPGSENGSLPSYGDAIVVASSGDARTLVPILASDSASSDICGFVFNGLVKYDRNIELVGDLAESWDIEDSGKTIIFHLRKGVRWHDGRNFTSRDVEYTYRKLIDPNVRTPYSGEYERVKDFIVIDDYMIKIIYKEPFAPALSSWGIWVMPEHILKNEDLNKTKFSRSPIGTGPYKFKSWKTGEKIELVSNHDYFEGRPYIDQFVYRIIPDPSTMFLELKTGGVDWMGLTPLQYREQTNTKFFQQNYRKFRYPSFAYTYLGFNLKHPWFSDKRVRQAIAYAIDKQEIVKAVLFSFGNTATGPYVPNTWPYNPNVKKYEHNPERAKALLKEAGWFDRNSDGILEKDGKPFEFTILTNMGNPSRVKTATIIQWRLGKIGIKVNIRELEWATFINEFIDKRRFEAVVLGWSITLDPDQYDIWHSTKTKEKELNFVSFSNQEVDDLLERGRRTFDIQERKKAYFRIQEILAEELPYIFLYVPDALPIISARFQGIEPAPIGISYNIEKWYVPKKLQKHRLSSE